MAEPAPILVVGPAWVGDMVMAQSLFITLKTRHPDRAIDVLAPGWSLPLIARMPEVRAGIEMPLGHGEFDLGLRRRLGHALRGTGYGQAIVLPRSFKSALTPFFARIPRRTGYRGELRYGLLNDIRPLDAQQLPRTVDRFVALGCTREAALPPPIPFPRLHRDPARQETLVATLGLGEDLAHPCIALMPGAEYGPAKQWPAFGELAAQLIAAGRRVWIFGSHKEKVLGDAIAGQAGTGARNLCGHTALADAVDLIGLCRAAVSNDSGLMHVAAAAGVPLVALYGSSTPDYTPPLTQQAEILWRRLPCSPCFERTCPLGHTDCLKGIPAASVLDALDRLPHTPV
ncbi:lipopolysaccharide heptosyltransferase II [Candidatus Macondimonas diazotrophica]|jgi:heptosyltransferase-2|uniref:lipopolysaccharide heptosyltransferase II n=1 Tax=Candidatus Macondimonas diazotrophica TaxID=2305248 RepID=A0A4Z0FCG4_9GAMM|nr:lipopolysaccharide heptosyltransferase II [Candidatus Macondimonas diazotrophica]NCU01587.1 lipopolysaccharide heptosyltransferase II [Candidatus Macondimonas diazotrophica]TFZ84218.1 lipopolysaccharide heptosyltransferase II [Candidatus Macondimonas diazotrophica]